MKNGVTECVMLHYAPELAILQGTIMQRLSRTLLYTMQRDNFTIAREMVSIFYAAHCVADRELAQTFDRTIAST